MLFAKPFKEPFEYLSSIGFFKFVSSEAKLEAIKTIMNRNFRDSGWIYLPSDDYVSEEAKEPKYDEAYSTSDFRTVEMGPEIAGESFLEYFREFVPILAKRNLPFEIGKEELDWGEAEDGSACLRHTVEVNGKPVKFFDGDPESGMEPPAVAYIEKCGNFLNGLVRDHGHDEYFILMGAQESVYLTLVDAGIHKRLLAIKDKVGNYFETF